MRMFGVVGGQLREAIKTHLHRKTHSNKLFELELVVQACIIPATYEAEAGGSPPS